MRTINVDTMLESKPTRLIDANALKRSFCNHCDGRDTMNGEPNCTKPCVDIGLIDTAPTIDAVQVVRCGECKYYKDGMCYNPNTYDDEKTCGNTTEDWFCADGKRKDKDDE